VGRSLRFPFLILALIFGVGGLAFYFHDAGQAGLVDRPRAAGAVGSLHVYGQNPAGPVRLIPGRVWQLPRPQNLAFELQVEGSGPRSIHIELEAGSKRWRMHNERIQAPKTNWYLEYIMTLDQNVPNNCTVIVRMDAPHAQAVESRFLIQLSDKKGN